MIRVGEITYANCLPIFAALRKLGRADDYEFVRGEPAALNRMLYQGKVDLAPCSSLEYALHPEEYFLIPDLSISSEEEVKSVLLISRLPIDQLDGKKILLSSASASSNALIRILLEKRYGHKCDYLFPEEDVPGNSSETEARVVIGNSALKSYLDKDEEKYIYDLSLLWNEFTGLPFVFALWIVRRDVVKRNPEEVSQLIQRLSRAKEYALSHLAEIAGEFAKVLEISEEDLIRYWESISYDMDQRKTESLRRYFDYAEELGLIPQSPPLKFFP
jgi:chorismate dehydratase